jgi:peptidyl-prolyl cis-trans isomerase D
VTAATVPPFVTSTREAAAVEQQLQNLLGNDLLSQYVAQLQKDIHVAVNEQALRRAVGGEL